MLQYFDFKTYSRIFRRSLSQKDSELIPPTPKRIVFLCCFYFIFFMVQMFNALCFTLDKIIYPAHRKIRPNQPVFILGNPRSGTTYIHRLMSMDTDRFFSFKTWEIIFPSIIQKKILSLFGRLDRLIGQPAYRAIVKKEESALSEFNRMHPTGLFYPEECELLLIHIFSTYNLLFLFPIKGEFAWLLDFDQSLPASDKNRIMSFYLECIRRQAFYLGHTGSLLSKSPAFSSKIKTLFEHFPECRVIYMLRSPLEVVPSVFSFAEGLSRSTTDFTINAEMHDNIYRMIQAFYEYPLSCLKEMDPDRYAIIQYDDLISEPSQVITSIYRSFGFELTPDHQRLLEEAEDKARKYNSRHRYSLERFNLSEEQIRRDFKSVFEYLDSLREETRPFELRKV